MVGSTMAQNNNVIDVPTNLEATLRIARALSSETRIQIINLVRNGGERNVSELAAELRQTEANVSAQVKILEKAKLLIPSYAPGKHGIQKNVKLATDFITFKFAEKSP